MKRIKNHLYTIEKIARTSAPSGSPTATAKPAPTKTGDSFCALTIGKTDIPIHHGVEEEAQKKSPGFIPSFGSAGNGGNLRHLWA